MTNGRLQSDLGHNHGHNQSPSAVARRLPAGLAITLAINLPLLLDRGRYLKALRAFEALKERLQNAPNTSKRILNSNERRPRR